MKKKKVSEMAFKEFWGEAKERGTPEVIEDPNFGMLSVLRKEGFSDEEINRMKMEKVWKFYMDSISMNFEQYITAISLIVKKNPERYPIFRPILKKLIDQLEKSRREFEEEIKKKGNDEI